MTKKRIQVAFVGGSGVGKSQLISRMVDKEFSPRYNATIGVDYFTKDILIKGQLSTLLLGDTAGQQRFPLLAKTCINAASIVVLVFDLCDEKSLAALNDEYLTVKNNHSRADSVSYVVVGNKLDKKERAVTSQEATQFAASIGADYMETSAKTAEGVSALEEKIVAVRVMQQKKEELALLYKKIEPFQDKGIPGVIELFLAIIESEDMKTAYEANTKALRDALIGVYIADTALFHELMIPLNEIKTTVGVSDQDLELAKKVYLLEAIAQFKMRNEHFQCENLPEITDLLSEIVGEDNVQQAYEIKKEALYETLLAVEKSNGPLFDNIINFLSVIQPKLDIPELEKYVKMCGLIKKIQDFRRDWGGNKHIDAIADLLNVIVSSGDQIQEMYGTLKGDLHKEIEALRWEYSSLFNRVVNFVTTVLLALALPILYCTGTLAANEKRNGHMFTFFAFGAEHAARTMELDMVSEMQLRLGPG